MSALPVAAQGQSADSAAARGAWRDPSPHRVDSVQVTDLKLQFLDWGGRGTLLVFLHGWGSNAHTFDDLAPRFTDRFHVVALTQRGFGSSSPPSSGYTIDRYADDAIRLVRKLGYQRASFAGHSFGGWVLTRIAASEPQVVDRLVYLDAVFNMLRSDSIIGLRPFARPSTAGIKNEAEYFEWLQRYFYGTWRPALEAEARLNARSRHSRAADSALAEARRSPEAWEQIGAPSLAVCALAEVESEFPWIAPASPDYASAKAYIDTIRRPFQSAECLRFGRTVRNSQTAQISGGHFIHAIRSGEVADAMRRFLVGGR